MRSGWRPAWIVFAGAFAAMAGAVILWVVGVEEPFTPDVVVYPTAYLAFAAVGALILGRQRANRIGILCLAAGALGSVVALVDSYGRLATPMPLQDWAAWLATWAFPMSFGLILAVLLLFPNGALPSRRWSVVAVLVLVGVVLVAVGGALTPRLADFPDVPNPIGQEWVSDSLIAEGGVGWFLLLIGAVAAVVSLVVRMRRAHGIERQQLKLVVAFAGVLNGVSWLVLALDLPGAAGELAVFAVFASFAAVPIAIGAAMLRYRLYDFDLVIRRTLVYGALSVMLGAAYIGLILGLQVLLSPFTGNDALAVALSTLAIAGLFGPVRGWVRGAVDRRFYRSRYDAQHTLESFGASLRDRVDLGGIAEELQMAATKTVRPVAAAVWLKPTWRADR